VRDQCASSGLLAVAQSSFRGQISDPTAPRHSKGIIHGVQMLTEIVTLVTTLWDWTTHDPVSFYTAVLALSTIALWIVTWRGIRGQSKDIRILQRAYVSVEPGGLTAHVDRSDRLHTTVTFRNVGHLPARDVRWCGTFATLGPDGGWRGNPDGNDFPVKETGGKIVFPVKKPTGGKIVLPPGTASTHHIGTVFTDRLLRCKLRSAARLY
jgi:hypothetical protein